MNKQTSIRYNNDINYMNDVNHIINSIPIPIYAMLRADLQSIGYAPYELFDIIHKCLSTYNKLEMQDTFPSVKYEEYKIYSDKLKEIQ